LELAAMNMPIASDIQPEPAELARKRATSRAGSTTTPPTSASARA
jgi:hypothetical protein